MFSLSNKTALVTGASSGLGEHFARVLVAQGARVVLAARRLEKLESLAEELKAGGGAALPVAMDVTSPDSVSAAFERIQTELGEPATILVNNSGMSRENWFNKMSEEDWSAVIDTNLTGVWRVAKAAVSAMQDAGVPGSVINIASVTALRPYPTLAAYASSKAAVDHLTRVMALEVARYGIRVNAIAPGYYETAINDEFLSSEAGQTMRKRIPMRRFGQHEELDGPLVLLASDASSYMTGATVVVDGGHVCASL